MLLDHHSVGYLLPVLLISAGIALVVTDARAYAARNERSAQLQHAAYELGRKVALAGPHARA